MLTANRPAMAAQAMECFRRQTYPAKRLYIHDTGTIPARQKNAAGSWRWEEHRGRTIGALRNQAIDWARMECGDADIIVHWDDDDWSHPARIAEQVAHLQTSGAEIVGYNEILFWRTGQECQEVGLSVHTWHPYTNDGKGGEAWLYHNTNPAYAVGTSLCYWRSTWARRPFPDRNEAEDLEFICGRKCEGVAGFAERRWDTTIGFETLKGPRMVARIHGGNTSIGYRPDAMIRAREWRRVPEWDRECREVFA